MGLSWSRGASLSMGGIVVEMVAVVVVVVVVVACVEACVYA
jgi:hypothetical protein